MNSPSKPFTPVSGPSESLIAAIEAFAAQARRAYGASPRLVDDCLYQASLAFTARNYAGNVRIIRPLLVPICNGRIDLGQQELVEDVLTVNVESCAAQYAVAMYMTSSERQRVRALLVAIDELSHVGRFFKPIQELEQVCVEPLPGLDTFLEQWQALLEKVRCARVAAEARRKLSNKAPQELGGTGQLPYRQEDAIPRWAEPEEHNESEEPEEDALLSFYNRHPSQFADDWLREVVHRRESCAGLARLARRDRDRRDIQEWCRQVEHEGDWRATQLAYEEGSLLDPSSAELCDSAALAIQVLGVEAPDPYLERAWRTTPTLTRLLRWLGRCETRAALLERCAIATDALPQDALRQRGLLLVLQEDLPGAAALLVEKAGADWHWDWHPGDLLMLVFAHLLGAQRLSPQSGLVRYEGVEANEHRPTLATPSLQALLERAEVHVGQHRSVLIEAMRAASTRWVDKVTQLKLRNRYSHAARFALLCSRVGATGQQWLQELRAAYRGFPALSRAFVEAERAEHLTTENG
ncbi:MAG: hypothetical protein RBU37_19055 [Myxococcota bacterium]|jgi:hypothetical protein|nr:hypothetical protein [Myxococcota bacterium]